MKFYKIKKIKEANMKKITSSYDSLGFPLKELLGIAKYHGGFLAGGAVQHLFDTSKNIKDLDFFFPHPECKQDDQSLEELEEDVLDAISEILPEFKVASAFLSNDGSRLVTLVEEGCTVTIQLVFSSSTKETFEECMKDRLSDFDLYSSIFAITVEDFNYVIYTTRKSLYSVRYMFAILNSQGKISPRNTMLRLSKLMHSGYYTKYAMDKLVDWIEDNYHLSYEFNDFTKELDQFGFCDGDVRVRVPPELLERQKKVKHEKSIRYKVSPQYTTNGNGS